MDKTSNISTLTTIGIDRQTGKLIDKLCKRYSLKKGEPAGKATYRPVSDTPTGL